MMLNNITVLKKDRDITLDVAKGISILLMTISHLSLFRDYPLIDSANSVFLLFRMPLFVVVSGILFSLRGSLTGFAIGKLDGLLKPTLFIISAGVFFSLLYQSFGSSGADTVMNTVFKVFAMVGPLWFPFILFAAQLIFSFFLYIKDFTYLVVTTTAILFFLLLLNSYDVTFSIIRLHSILIFTVYLVIGYLLNKYDVINKLYNGKIFVSSVFFFICLLLFREKLDIKLDLFFNIYGSFLPTLLASLLGVVVMLNLSKIVAMKTKVASVFVLCSKSSFFILAFHQFIGNDILYQLGRQYFEKSVLFDTFCFVITIGLCILIHKLVIKSRYLKYGLLPVKSIKPKLLNVKA